MTQSWLWSRPLVPLTAALAAGIAAPSLGGAIPPSWLFILIPVLILLLAVLIWRRWPVSWAVYLLFFGLGQGLFHQAVNPPLSATHLRFVPQQSPISLLGTVQGRSLSWGESYALDLAALAWSDSQTWRPASGLVRLYGLPVSASCKPGETIVVRLRLRPVVTGTPMEADGRSLALARRDIFVTGQLWPHLPPVKVLTEPTLTGWQAWRRAIRLAWYGFLESQPQPARSVFLALLLGDQSEISPELRASLQRTGTSHLLAISGLHLGMIMATTVLVIFWLLRRWTWFLLRFNAIKTAFLLAAGPMLAYAWLAGSSPATHRAACMLLAGLFLLLLDRPKDPLNLLALAALIILVVSPLQLYSLSFQLSFLSIWGLITLRPVLVTIWHNRLALIESWPAWLRQSVFWLGRALATITAATLATLPVVLTAFHQVPTYGILVNLVAVPLFGSIILPLGFLAVLFSWCPPLALGLITLSRWALTIGLIIINGAADLPGVVLRLPAPTLLQTMAYLAVLAGLFLATTRSWRWLGIIAGTVVLGGSMLFAGLHSWTQDDLQVTAVQGGRELSLVARLPGGAVMVINAGRPQAVAQSAAPEQTFVRFLHARQYLRLDYLAALTVTAQNAPTLLALAREFELQEFWYSGDRPPVSAFWELMNYLGDRRTKVRNLSLNPAEENMGGVKIESRQLPGSLAGRSEGPVVLTFKYQGRAVLIVPPGSAAWRERCLLAGLPPSEVLILPVSNLHEDFVAGCLTQVKPQALIITGSPSIRALETLRKVWLGTVYQTDQGDVTVTIGADAVKIGP